MILVSVVCDQDDVSSIRIEGHGDPLVCAGTSTCFVGACNALEKIEAFKVKIHSGDSLLESTAKINDHDTVVIETLLVQLTTLQEKYPNEICVRRTWKKGQQNETQI